MRRYSLYLILLITTGCFKGSDSENNAAYTDSIDVTAVAEPAAIDSVSPPRVITLEDTIKGIKNVYVLYNDLNFIEDTTSGVGYGALNFGQKVDVLNEYGEWYQARIGYGRDAQVFYIRKDVTGTESLLFTNLFYPDFEFKILDFQCYGISGESYQGNTEEAELIIDDENIYGKGLKVKTDTIDLFESMDNYITNKVIKITPKNKNDRFKVYSAVGQSVYEITDERLNHVTAKELENYKTTNWKIYSPYKELGDSLNFYYKIQDWIGEYDEKANLEIIKKKYSLRDTNIVLEGEYDTYITLTRKNKFFNYGISGLHLRIDRIVGGKVIERKYINIYDDPEGGC